MELLRIENLKKIIKKRTIVDSLNMTVNSGEIVGFLGPNGAGKTTTIKMILGLFKISDGKISICGRDVETDFENAMKNVGGIVENPDLYKRMTGRQNLQYFASMHDNISKKHINDVSNLVKMSDRIDDKVKTYSLGMRQRVGLAQALLHQPRLLVLDEPTNGLDPIGIKEMRDLLKYLAKEAGTGVLVSSHLLSEMELMCDRIYVIDEGKLIGEKKIGATESDNHLEEIFKYSFVTSNNEVVHKLFKEMKTNCEITNTETTLVMKRGLIPSIIKQIMDKEIDIYAINQSQRSLEDEFISMTTGTKGQIK